MSNIDFNFGANAEDEHQKDLENIWTQDDDLDALADYVKWEVKMLTKKVKEKLNDYGKNIRRIDTGSGRPISGSGILEEGNDDRRPNIGDVPDERWQELQRAFNQTSHREGRKKR